MRQEKENGRKQELEGPNALVCRNDHNGSRTGPRLSPMMLDTGVRLLCNNAVSERSCGGPVVISADLNCESLDASVARHCDNTHTKIFPQANPTHGFPPSDNRQQGRRSFA